MNRIKILALFGESSSGKDSIQNWMVNNIENTHKIISYTTRPPRENEKDGEDYYFISQKEFLKEILQNKMLEYSYFNDWYYGTMKSSFEKDKINIGIFNPQGIRSLILKSEHDLSFEVLPVWIQVDDRTRLLRSLNREKNPNYEEICRRFLTDKKDFSNLDFNYEVFLNDKDNFSNILNRPEINKFFKDEIN